MLFANILSGLILAIITIIWKVVFKDVITLTVFTLLAVSWLISEVLIRIPTQETILGGIVIRLGYVIGAVIYLCIQRSKNNKILDTEKEVLK